MAIYARWERSWTLTGTLVARPDSRVAPLTSSEIEILGYRLRVIAPHEILAPLRQRLAVPTGCVDAGRAGYALTISVTPAADHPGYFLVVQDGQAPAMIPRESIARHLEWLVHAAAIGKLRRRHLLLHAGAVAWGDAGFILCASSGSGKSTLTAGLVAGGFQYLSDEVAALDPDSLMMQPYPRPICVKAGSREALAAHYPALADEQPELRSDGEAVWYLPLAEHAWRREPVAPRFLIFPRYEPGAVTRLSAISRRAALERLAAQSFSGDALGARGLGALARLAAATECFELTAGSLDAGVSAVRRLAER